MKFLRVACLASPLLLLPVISAADGAMTVRPGSHVENPPKQVAKKAPKPADFEAIFNAFLGVDYITVRNSDIDPRLTALFAIETSNSLYNRLKLAEPNHDGAILITPLNVDNEQIIAIAARICYWKSGKKILASEYLNVIFSRRGVFQRVTRGVRTNQQL